MLPKQSTKTSHVRFEGHTRFGQYRLRTADDLRLFGITTGRLKSCAINRSSLLPRSIAGLASWARSVSLAQCFLAAHRIGFYEGVFLRSEVKNKLANDHIVKLILHSRTNVNFPKKKKKLF